MLTAVLIAALTLPLFAQSPFNEKPSYGRSRDYDLQHLKLELGFDVPARKLTGTATLRMTPLSGDLREIALDSAELAIDSVTVGGKAAQFRTDAQKLYVMLDRQSPAG